MSQVELKDLLKQVPTIDEDVRRTLQQLGEPQTFFGEDNADRRARLVDLVANDETVRAQFGRLIGLDGEIDSAEDEDEEFYTPGDDDVYDSRVFVANYSLPRARARVTAQAQLFNEFKPVDILLERRKYNESLKSVSLQGSQVVSDRCTSVLKYSRDQKYIACGSWDGKTYLFDDKLELQRVLEGHEEKVGGIDWHPNNNKIIATSGSEGLIQIYNIGDESARTTLKGHEQRVARIQFHPSGRFLASASFDYTWRFWDVEKAKELYYQEGHSKEVFSVAHQPDGSLIASGGLDAIGRVWDLRTGKSIWVMEDHAKGIYGMDWRQNGYELLTGGGDANLKVWDIRNNRKPKHNIIAHSKLISDLKVSSNDKFMVSSSYDGYLDLISCDNWIVVKKFKAPEKLMCCDISNDCLNIVSGGWDRCVNLYNDL
ncbi:hypothetical protein OGAPHI_003415 [Ogataea philodendri]|uniref:Pre-mRNA processing factor 4 (PRP4)-like domain-containing protein n=1 Tax=Ogataea philodendri TaxID=1378263 RepID=A0A9P8T6C9_9ASCO|nr:uncharacterized protein OGAPHI_003415 [Ogataea philodendri]KAH3666965.1 hypothetical protein OGAPHI_003415 [Ogataea philodendri]